MCFSSFVPSFPLFSLSIWRNWLIDLPIGKYANGSERGCTQTNATPKRSIESRLIQKSTRSTEKKKVKMGKEEGNPLLQRVKNRRKRYLCNVRRAGWHCTLMTDYTEIILID